MFENKTFLITGASSGLGKELAILALSLGANVSLCARREHELLWFYEKYGKKKVLIEPLDVTDKVLVENWVLKTAENFKNIDFVIANAGQSMWSRFKDLNDPDDMKKLMDINYLGVVNTLFYTLPYLRKNKGTFVSISSIQGVIPVVLHSGYVAAKHAVNALISTVRQEEKKVHFLLVMPGWIGNTDLRKNAIMADKDDAIRVKAEHGKNVINKTKLAKTIFESIKRSDDELFVPKKFKWLPLLRYFFPHTLDKIVEKKVFSQTHHLKD